MKIQTKELAVVTLILTFAIVPSLAFAVKSTPVNSISQHGLSKAGEGAFEDLARCVRSEDSTNLNIFFLIDSSASLRKNDDGGPGSDPNDLRADILSQSIRQLNSLNQKIRVNFALDTFDSTSPGTGSKGHKRNSRLSWTPAGADEVKNASAWVEKNVPGYDYGQRTNWLAGLENARTQLANAPPSSGRSCKAIIWFTDGALDVDGVSDSNSSAIEQLCGIAPDSSQAGAQKGIIPSLRASDISLIGVLLAPTKSTPGKAGLVSYFQPIVEGRGIVDASSFGGTSSQSFECGKNPIPLNYARGAMLVANNPDDLAFLFASIPYIVSKGQAIRDLKNNEFSVDAGVASAAVVVASRKWTLSGPNLFLNSESNDPAFKINTVGNISTIEFVIPKDGQGQYKVVTKAKTPIAVFLESGIRIKLDQSKTITAGAGPQNISGMFTDFSGIPVDMSVYETPIMSVTSVDTSGSNRESKKTSLNVAGSGKWSGQVIPFDGAASAEMHISVLLKTIKSKTSLPEISQTFIVPLLVPDQYCTLVLPKSEGGDTTQLSDLVFKKKPATGAFTIKGAKSGNCSVKISSPVVISDVLGRGPADFNISIENSDSDRSSALNAWVVIPQNVSREFEINVDSAKSNVKANGKTLMNLPIEVRDEAATQSIHSAIQFSFDEVVPEHNKFFLIFLLTLLGLGLPLSLLQVVNFQSARYKLDDVRITSFPVRVRIGDTSSSVTLADGSPIMLQDRMFEYLPSDLKKPKKFVADFKGRKLAIFDSHLPRNPFGNVRGTVNTTPGSVIVASESTRTSRDGTQAPVSLNLNRLFFATTEVMTSVKADSTEFVAPLASAFDDDMSLTSTGTAVTKTPQSNGNRPSDENSFDAQLSVYLNIDPVEGAKLFASVVNDINTSQMWVELGRLKTTALTSPFARNVGEKNESRKEKVKKEKKEPNKVSDAQISSDATAKDNHFGSSRGADSPKNLLSDPDDPWA